MGSVWFDGVEGLNQLVTDLGSAAPRVGARAAAAVRKTAHSIEATAQAFAPVDTGNLRSSIGTDFDGDGRSARFAATIGPTADYGAFVEFGTARQAPQAYMGPSFDRHAGDLDQALIEIAGEIL